MISQINTPFLVIRQEGSCFVEFGDSNRKMAVNNSISPPFLDEEGHAFKLHVLKSSTQSTHRKNQRFSERQNSGKVTKNIWSAVKIVIPPKLPSQYDSCQFPKGSNCLYVKKVFSTNRNPDDVYAPPDSLILRVIQGCMSLISLPPPVYFRSAKYSG